MSYNFTIVTLCVVSCECLLVSVKNRAAIRLKILIAINRAINIFNRD